jgi:hypothetical protein
VQVYAERLGDVRDDILQLGRQRTVGGRHPTTNEHGSERDRSTEGRTSPLSSSITSEKPRRLVNHEHGRDVLRDQVL